MVRDDKKETLNSLITYSSVGIEMGVSLVIGLAMGYYLDRHFGTSPILTLIFTGFGLAAGMRRVYTLWRKMERDNERDDNR